MSNEVLMINTDINDEGIFGESNDFYYRAIIGNDQNTNLENTDIIVNDRRELESLFLTLGDNVTPIIAKKDQASYKDLLHDLYEKPIPESFEWNYRDPKEAHKIITRISMPDYIRESLSGDRNSIPKQYVHKVNQNNVLISYPERLGNMLLLPLQVQ